MTVGELTGYAGNLRAYAKHQSEGLTATDVAWIPATSATTVIVVLSLTWIIISGTTVSISFQGATNYPGGDNEMATTAGVPHQHYCEVGLFRSTLGGGIGVTLSGTTPVVSVSATYVEFDANGRFV